MAINEKSRPSVAPDRKRQAKIPDNSLAHERRNSNGKRDYEGAL